MVVPYVAKNDQNQETQFLETEKKLTNILKHNLATDQKVKQYNQILNKKIITKPKTNTNLPGIIHQHVEKDNDSTFYSIDHQENDSSSSFLNTT